MHGAPQRLRSRASNFLLASVAVLRDERYVSTILQLLLMRSLPSTAVELRMVSVPGIQTVEQGQHPRPSEGRYSGGSDEPTGAGMVAAWAIDASKAIGTKREVKDFMMSLYVCYRFGGRW